MEKMNEFNYWKNEFETSSVFKENPAFLKIYDDGEIALYRLKSKDSIDISFKIDFRPEFESDFSTVVLGNEDIYYPTTKEGFNDALEFLIKKINKL